MPIRSTARKTAPKVKDGRVQKKHRHDASEYLALVDGRSFTVLKHRAREGYRHVVQLPDVYRFVELIPSWSTVSNGLSALALDAYGCEEQTGCHYDPGYRAIWMRPFPEAMQTTWSRRYHDVHGEFTSRLGVESVREDDRSVTLTWTLAQARAWQLLHLFLHELSVHAQFMRGGQKPRSEHDAEEAEQYAFRTAARILPAYEKALGRIL